MFFNFHTAWFLKEVFKKILETSTRNFSVCSGPVGRTGAIETVEKCLRISIWVFLPGVAYKTKSAVRTLVDDHVTQFWVHFHRYQHRGKSTVVKNFHKKWGGELNLLILEMHSIWNEFSSLGGLSNIKVLNLK